MSAPAGAVGVIYLLHFRTPYRHAKHYLGWTLDPAARLTTHSLGHGSPLVQAAMAGGDGWQLARAWLGDRHRERQLKQRGHSRYCPACRPELRLRLGDAVLAAAVSSLLQQCQSRRAGPRSTVFCGELRNGAHGPQHVGWSPGGRLFRWPVTMLAPVPR